MLFPEELAEAKRLLDSFSRQPIIDKRASAEAFFRAIRMLSVFLKDNHGSGQAQRIRNIKKTYTREFVQRLREFAPREREDFNFGDEVLLKLLIYCGGELKVILDEDPGYKQYFDDAGVDAKWTDLLRQAVQYMDADNERSQLMSPSKNTYPKLHNAAWPGLVGKGEGSEPPIGLDKMIELTTAAEVDGVKFDGMDLFLSDPHVSIDLDADGVRKLADTFKAKHLAIGSLVAPVWPPTGGGSTMGSADERKQFVAQVRKACNIGMQLRELGARPYGVIRIDSACGVGEWDADPTGGTRKIADTFREACVVAEDHGERLAAEGEICWGGMHSWKEMIKLLEMVDRPKTLGFQADMAHTLLYTLGANAEKDAILPAGYDWKDQSVLDAALKTLTDALRPWTIDFHIAQNDATVFGSGSHDKTGRHCLPNDPNGKLDIVKHAGLWMRGADGAPTKAFQHVCWDGCMFPNETMMKQETWNSILGVMAKVRDAHGW